VNEPSRAAFERAVQARTAEIERLDAFMEVYARQLAVAVQKYPEQYAYPVDKVPLVVAKMRPAVADGSYNHTSHAFRWTCKELKIPHTRKAIKAFLAGET
jgi:3'-phosphoadenosine 5'-phosphosulfate sulfotransferase (PAPS reductase)/FAD synthetase